MASTPYATAAAFYGKPPTWINTGDGQRLQAYDFYADLFDNDTDSFKITLRDDEENPIYVPSAKRIIKTMARYVARDLGFTAVGGTPEQQLVAITSYGDLFNREEFFSLFATSKLYGLARGDWLMMLIGNVNKPEGSRISIKAIDPSNYFPIWDAADSTRVVGQQLIEQVTIENKVYVQVQRWLTARSVGHPNYDELKFDLTGIPIVYDMVQYEVSDWEDPVKRKVFATPAPQAPLDGIFSLPIYHFRAEDRPRAKFGTSLLSGLERLFLAINQAVTDEDVAVSMSGLGVYVTDQKPVDENENETDWVIGPRRVVELPGGTGEKAGGVKAHFDRVDGVTSVKASQDHYKWILAMAESVHGIGEVALGIVEATIAESGIALALRFAPILDEAGKIDLGIVSVLKHMFYDLKDWFAAYEGITLIPEVTVEPVLGPKLPVDVDKKMSQLSDLWLGGALPTLVYLTKLNELGMDLGDPQTLIDQAATEAADKLAAQQAALGGTVDSTGTDGFGNRLNQEAGGDPSSDPAAA